jgi:hypothetical protein
VVDPMDVTRALAFNAVSHALPVDRFLLLSERQAVADAVIAAIEPGIRDAAYAAGREAAAQAIESSDEWWPADDPIGIVTRATEIARGDQ